MQKNGYYFSRAHRSHYLESLQAIAYSNTEDEFNSNMNLLRNTHKNKSVMDYCQENRLLFKEQWVKCFKSQMSNMTKTTSNMLEPTFKKMKNVFSKYANLVNF